MEKGTGVRQDPTFSTFMLIVFLLSVLSMRKAQTRGPQREREKTGYTQSESGSLVEYQGLNGKSVLFPENGRYVKLGIAVHHTTTAVVNRFSIRNKKHAYLVKNRVSELVKHVGIPVAQFQ